MDALTRPADPAQGEPPVDSAQSVTENGSSLNDSSLKPLIEFDRFLLERGAAAAGTDSVPSIPAQTGQQQQQQQQVRNTRTLQKDEEENPLFAL